MLLLLINILAPLRNQHPWLRTSGLDSEGSAAGAVLPGNTCAAHVLLSSRCAVSLPSPSLRKLYKLHSVNLQAFLLSILAVHCFNVSATHHSAYYRYASHILMYTFPVRTVTFFSTPSHNKHNITCTFIVSLYVVKIQLYI